MERIFRKTGEFLVDLLHMERPEKGKSELQHELTLLQAGGGESVRDYYIRKMMRILAVLAAGLIVTVLCFFIGREKSREVEGQQVRRPDYGESSRREILEVQVDGEEVQEVEITVQGRQYTDEERQRLTDRAIETLDELLPGENPSLDEVRQNLVFPESLENGAVSVHWMTVPYGVIDESGRLLGSEDENGVLVEIQGTLTCGGKETLYTVYARVFPQELPEQERLHQSIIREVERADQRDGEGEVLKLPAFADGKKLLWMKEGQNPAVIVLALTMIAAAGIYLEMDSQVHKRAEKRREQLLLDYPDLMWKMTMLLGAGLGMKGVFLRLSDQYHKGREQEKRISGTAILRSRKRRRSRNLSLKVRYVYEEIAYACYEMESGIPEAEAYERFGRRCQLPEYIRLGSVLSQNLKKGAKGLTELLEREAAASLTERKNNARKLSEKAGTKLLLPMMLMLGIVLAVLMIPAFLSF